MFKVGDKVKILQSATDVFVYDAVIGKVAEVIDIYFPKCRGDYEISVDDGEYIWRLRREDFEEIGPIEKQLYFSFVKA